MGSLRQSRAVGRLRRSRAVYAGALDAAVKGAALPYGYTVTIWSSGQVLIDRGGKPGVGSVFGVLLGAVAAFGVLRLSTLGADADTDASQLAAAHHAIRTGVIHVATIAATVGSVALIALIGSWIMWPLGGFSATALYLGGTSVALAVM